MASKLDSKLLCLVRTHIFQIVIITGRIFLKGSYAGIVFTHELIFGFFAPQGRHVAPIKE